MSNGDHEDQKIKQDAEQPAQFFRVILSTIVPGRNTDDLTNAQ